MSDDSEQVAALIKEPLILSRADSAPPVEPPTATEVEERKSKRKRLRQDLYKFSIFVTGKSLAPDKRHLLQMGSDSVLQLASIPDTGPIANY